MKPVPVILKIAGLLLLIILGVVLTHCAADIASFNMLLDMENYTKALEVADRMVHARPGDLSALNKRALALIHLEREEEAISILEQILSKNPQNDTALNNMSLAFFNLEQYDKALEFARKSLEIEPNRAMEYNHYGNVLLALEKYAEARDAYTRSLAEDDSIPGSIFGLGYAYYCLGEYDHAITQFRQCTIINPLDENAQEYLGYSYLFSGQPEKALEKVSALMSIATYRRIKTIYEDETISGVLLKAYKLQAISENYQGEYQKAFETLKKAKEIDEDDDLYAMLGELHHTLGNYTESIQAYNRQAELSPGKASPHFQNVYNYLALEDIPSAFAAAEKAIALEPENEEAINALGNVYAWVTRYREAFDCFQQAVMVNPDYVTGHVNSMWALYQSGLYRKCLEYGEAIAGRFPEEPDIYGYIGDCWSKLQETEKAVENLKRAAEHTENPVLFYNEIALQYCYDQQYDLAESAIQSALALEPENAISLMLKEEIECTKDPLSNRIASFVEQYYLYSDQIQDLDLRLKQFSKSNADASDVYDFIESIRLEDDFFTFCFFDEEYDLYWELEDQKTVFYRQILQNTGKTVHYFDIDFFGSNTANEFIEIAEELPDKENSILVIDLRDNGGGLMESCTEMLDYLLHSCVIGNLIYRDGTSSSWYSDEDAVTFEEIFVLINGYTASSSEMLALGLKKNLHNVTVVGEPSYGKGVGQVVFDSRKDRVCVMLVNFYWNVQDENLVNSRIEPDIQAGGDLENYLEKVRIALLES